MRALVPRITCVLVAVALVACRESSGPREVQQYSYAIFNADIVADESGGLTTDPIGFFFRAPALDLPSSQGGQEFCQLQRIGTGGASLPLFITAGDSVVFAPEGGSTVYLKPRTENNLTAYRLSDEDGVPVTPGATVTFTVPGAASGFPASNIAVKTVEPYTMSAVPDEIPVGESVVLTWTPAGSGGSRMDIAFAYATTPDGQLNEQLYCSLLDDGEHDVPSSALNGFRAAASGIREFSSRRWRTSFKDLGGSVMLAISSYEAPPQEWR